MRTWLAPRDGQSGARQDRPTRARYRPLLLDAIGFVAYGLELLGTPTRMSRLGPQHRSAHLLGARIGVMLRGARVVLQAVPTPILVLRPHPLATLSPHP